VGGVQLVAGRETLRVAEEALPMQRRRSLSLQLELRVPLPLPALQSQRRRC
jgi:hypothetical protein|tara:strand:+ start:324 stop:476 length:153 start_codon:yes stop_codon:yes gene_type:complete